MGGCPHSVLTEAGDQGHEEGDSGGTVTTSFLPSSGVSTHSALKVMGESALTVGSGGRVLEVLGRGCWGQGDFSGQVRGEGQDKWTEEGRT